MEQLPLVQPECNIRQMVQHIHDVREREDSPRNVVKVLQSNEAREEVESLESPNTALVEQLLCAFPDLPAHGIVRWVVVWGRVWVDWCGAVWCGVRW